MKESSASALKEWAVVDEALATGRVSLLVRKGGIHERAGDFDVEHGEFWIFPSGWHQNPADLAAELHPLLNAIGPQPRGTIPFRTYCVVDGVHRIESPEVLDRIQGLHPLSPPAAHYRFNYRNRPYVHALLVRAYRLDEPVTLPDVHRYEGCVSWVQLDHPLPTAGLRPVLTDDEFAAVRADILERLGAPGTNTSGTSSASS
ncbi:MAG TPA: DUF1802 family protein [Longimicrobium sp.]|jgi:hypothetical protein|uniref:DUF1802 family protein n=1 Tax=Longimicrobium sp. TaxID=2029185 RepID=UPI002ED87978